MNGAYPVECQQVENMFLFLRVWAARLSGLFGRNRRDRELDEELRSHLDMLAGENLRRGMTAEEARLAAQRSFGGATQIREEYRARRGLPLLETLWQDLRYAFRNLARTPGFTAAAILSLALGIGANSAIFSFVDGLIVRPLDLPRAGEIVRVHAVTPRNRFGQLSYRDYVAYRDQNKTLAGLVAETDAGFAVKFRENELARLLAGQLVSSNFFSV